MPTTIKAIVIMTALNVSNLFPNPVCAEPDGTLEPAASVESEPPLPKLYDHSRTKRVSAVTDAHIVRQGRWWEWIQRQGHPDDQHLRTVEPGASLTRTFEGTGLVLVLDTHLHYVYRGGPNAGLVDVLVDGELLRTIEPLLEANEITILRGLPPGRREVTFHHRPGPLGTVGFCLLGFRELHEPTADLSFSLSGDDPKLLVDARIVVWEGGKVVRSSLQRNWISGMVRLAGLPPGKGYQLTVQALGWQPISLPLPELHPDSERVLNPLVLKRDPLLAMNGFARPRHGHPAIRRPGDQLKVEFEDGHEAARLKKLFWEQRVERAVRRVLLWAGDMPVGDREAALEINLPGDKLDGLGDLVAVLAHPAAPRLWRAPRSLRFRARWPEQPVFLMMGHLDVWGQYQAEFLAQFARMANIIGPDMVVLSNDVNPAYVAGGLRDMQVPHITTIGNHSVGYENSPSFQDAAGNPVEASPDMPFSYSFGGTMQLSGTGWPQYARHLQVNRDFDDWYGDPIHLVEIGPQIAILNYGWGWNPNQNAEAIEIARKRLQEAGQRRILIVNAFQGDITERLLDEFPISLVHCAHNFGSATSYRDGAEGDYSRANFLAKNGRVQFLGKRASDVFWIVEYANNRAAGFGWMYKGEKRPSWYRHEQVPEGGGIVPFPLGRHRLAPLRVEFAELGNGAHAAELINHLPRDFRQCTITWALPSGEWTFEGATLDNSWDSDDGQWSVFTLRADVKAESSIRVLANQK